MGCERPKTASRAGWRKTPVAQQMPSCIPNSIHKRKGEMAERYEPETKALSHRDSFGECEPLISGSSHLRLEEYALSLVSALALGARDWGAPRF
jgi:hypothetical protein